MNPPEQIFAVVLAILIAIPVHEFAHAMSAVSAGDDGPRRANRLSIMPWDHFDPLGAIFCLMSSIFGIGLGWGKPVMVDPRALRNPKWDMCKIAAWGPFSNLLLAIGFALILRSGVTGANEMLTFILLVFVQVNLGLMLFNLIPVGPLDGAKVLVAFLPDRQAWEFQKFQEQWGMLLLFALLTLGRGLLNILIGVPMDALMGLLFYGYGT